MDDPVQAGIAANRDQAKVKALERIATALETIANQVSPPNKQAHALFEVLTRMISRK